MVSVALADRDYCSPSGIPRPDTVITSYSIHYTKLYDTCVAPFVQKAAAFALSDSDVQTAAAEMRAAYARRRELVLSIASESDSGKVLVTPSMGAFYFFLDFRALGLKSVEICERLLDEAGVGLVPGSAFGAQGEGFIRMTIAASDVV